MAARRPKAVERKVRKPKATSVNKRRSGTEKTEIYRATVTLTKDAMGMLDAMLAAEGSWSRSALIERAVRALYKTHAASEPKRKVRGSK